MLPIKLRTIPHLVDVCVPFLSPLNITDNTGSCLLLLPSEVEQQIASLEM